jgi:hypothetical protein
LYGYIRVQGVPGGLGEECLEAEEDIENLYNGGAEVQRTVEA